MQNHPGLLLWLLRLALYGVCAYLALFIIRPAIGGIAGMAAAIPFAAVAIALDLAVTAKLRSITFEQAATSRMLFVDAVLSPPGESLAEQHQAGQLKGADEVVDVEVLESGEAPQLQQKNDWTG